MTDIQAEEIDHFHRGQRVLMRITAPGTFVTQTKDGPVELAFTPGDVLLADASGNVIVPPVAAEGIADMAARILDGDQRAITDPLSMLALATAAVGLLAPPPPPRSPVEAARAAAMEAARG